jgi:germacradienol/geosmin synthase
VASAGRDRNRILDPVEFVTLRREVGGIFWSSDLVEHSLNAEIPAQLYDTRPIRVLRETFADAAGLRNDIISYLIDIEEGKVNNGVVVMQHFLGCGLQRAVDVVNEQVTFRLQQLENTVATELAPLFEEHGLHPLARQQVLRYAKALQDWLAGDLKWELQPGGRYLPATSEGSRSSKPASREGLPLGPTGLGTSAARVSLTLGTLGPQRIKSFSHVPYGPVKPVKPSKFYMPFSSKVNSHLDAARRHSKQWARQMGMLDSLPGFPGIYICDEHKFDIMDLPLCGALIHPRASESEVNLTSDLLFWGTYADDYFLEMFGHTGDMVGARVFHARLQAIMPDDPSLSTLTPINPVERGLADLWSRVAGSTSMDARRRFRLDIQKMLESWLWELANRLQNRIPDPVDYIEMRRLTFGAEIMLNVSFLEEDGKLPPGLLRSPQIRGLVAAAADYIGPLNDIFSYQKEVEHEGELSNGVLVAQRFLDMDDQQAVDVLNELMTARVRQFEHIIATELPALAHDFNLDREGRDRLDRYVERLQYCVSGLLKWHLVSGRYKESEASNASNLSRWRRRSRGLGTSAMRVAELLGGKPSGLKFSR